MSNSYKKSPVFTDQSHSRKHASGRTSVVNKRLANKKVRRTKDIQSGKSYRKVFDSWKISDWRNRADEGPHEFAKSMVEGWRGWKDIDWHESQKTLVQWTREYDDWYQYWFKCFRRK